MQNYKLEREIKNRADWAKSIEEAVVLFEEEEVTIYPTFYGMQVFIRVFKKICLRVLR
jgi:hypothetical protein